MDWRCTFLVRRSHSFVCRSIRRMVLEISWSENTATGIFQNFSETHKNIEEQNALKHMR